MTIWLLILLVIVVVGVLVWRSERRNRQIHGAGYPDAGGMDHRAAQARYRNEGGGASGGGGGV